MSPTSRRGVPTDLLQAFYEGGNVGNILLAKWCGEQLRHGCLRFFDEGDRLAQILLCRLALERRPDATLTRCAVTSTAILGKYRFAVIAGRTAHRCGGVLGNRDEFRIVLVETGGQNHDLWRSGRRGKCSSRNIPRGCRKILLATCFVSDYAS